VEGVRRGLSRMPGNWHVRFLGEGVAARSPPYPPCTVNCGRSGSGTHTSTTLMDVACTYGARFVEGASPMALCPAHIRAVAPIVVDV